MSMDDIGVLISQSKQGDEDAIKRLLCKYEPLIKKYSTHYFIKGYDEEDLEQIAKMAVFNGINKFDDKNGANFTGFVNVIIRNSILTLLNKRENKIVFSSLESVNEEGHEFKEMFLDDFDLEGSYIEKEDMSRLKYELNKLGYEDRRLLIMSFEGYGGLKKYSEITNTSYFACRRKRDKLVEKIRKKLI